MLLHVMIGGVLVCAALIWGAATYVLASSFCQAVYHRKRGTPDAQDLKSCECYVREVLDAPDLCIACLQKSH
jgi:hypothetical protein